MSLIINIFKETQKLKTPSSIQYTTDHQLSNDTNVINSSNILHTFSSKMSFLYIFIYDIFYINKSLLIKA